MNNKKKYLRIPGYVFSAEIHIPQFSAYSLWLSAFLKNIADGNRSVDFDQLPWPKNDYFVKSNIINYLLDEGLLYYDGDGFGVDEKVVSELSSTEGIKNYFFKEDRYTGKWWIDALTGVVLPYKLFNKYEVDLSATFGGKKELLFIDEKKVNSFYEMESLIDADISELMQTVFRGNDYNEIDKAYIKNNLVIENEIKDIEIPISDYRLIPSDLPKMETLIKTEFNELFSEERKIVQRNINWRLSPVEVFAETLESLSDNSNIDIKQISKLKELLRSKNEWLSWLNNGEIVKPIVGNSTSFQFAALHDICTKVKSDDTLIIVSSFLNVRNTKGLADTLEACDLDSNIIILYGHPDENDGAAIEAVIREYKDTLISCLPGRNIRILATEHRSHEKIFFSTNGDWMLGSWNATSSPIDTIRFETSVAGHSVAFARKLLKRIKGILDTEAYRLLNEKMPLNNRVINAKGDDLKYTALKKMTEALYDNFENADIILYVNNIRKLLYPFISKTKLTIINEFQTRELLMKQIHSAKKEIFMATDSIKASGFDESIFKEVERGVFGKKYLCVMWGRNYERTKEDNAALSAIERARERLEDFFISDEKPMENHSKFAIIDANRVFVTSENLLNYGGEKNAYESRETGLLIENQFVSRTIQGAAVLHKANVFSNKTQNVYELLFLGNEAYKTLKTMDDESLDYKDHAIVKSTIDLEIEQQYHALKLKFDATVNELTNIGVAHYMLNPNSTNDQWIPFNENLKSTPVLDVPNMSKQVIEKDDDISKAIAILNSHMVLINKGSFMMGSDAVKEERPVHKVIIAQNLEASKYLLTQEIWELVMGNLPANITKLQRGPKRPIFHVSFMDVQRFLKKINEYATSGFYDLPTEAEWEYMCKAGAKTKYTCGNSVDELDKYAWSKRNAKGKIMDVGLKMANKFGLYDIHGLMFEMCKDYQRKYKEGTIHNPTGELNHNMVVTPGGAWGSTPGLKPAQRDYFRCSARNVTKKTDSSYRLSVRLIKREV